MNKVQNKPTLLFCVLMDFLGSVSYFLPFIGEWGDMLWAPISAFIFYKSFRGKSRAIGTIVNFIEELLPFTDFVPTFTIGYLYNRYFNK
ncbi:MAG: hypothetical protein ACOYMD_04705 [Paludibacter sp.]